MTELNGYVKLHRKLVQWGWYKDYVVKDVFLHLLIRASFRETKWMGRVISPGQLVTTYKALASELGFTVQTVRTAISKLESTGELTRESTNKFTVITLVNWGKYQSDEELSTRTSTNDQQTKNAVFCEQIVNKLKSLQKTTHKSTNKDELVALVNSEVLELEQLVATHTLTNEQQTTNKQLTNKQQHRKNIKNVKNVKKNIGGSAAGSFGTDETEEDLERIRRLAK